MIRFNNDYNHGALDSILSALTATNTDSFAGYGEDIWCQRAEILSPPVKLHYAIFVVLLV